MAEDLRIRVLLQNLATRGISSIQKSMGGLQRATSAVGGAVTSLQGKIAALGITLGGGLFIRDVVTTFAEFDDTMRAVGAVSGATAEEFEMLTDIAKEMGRTTKFSASEAADGLRFLSMAGFDATEATEALPGTLDLAAAGALDLGQAADIATNILTGFGLEVGQLNQVNDVLVSTFTSANTNLVELGEGFKLVGPIAAGVGADFEDLVGTLGKLADAGLKGTLGGTALRGAINALLNPTAEEAKLMESLTDRMGGVALKTRDAAGNFIGFAEVITQLEKAGLRGDEALELFGLRAGPAMAALLGIGGDALSEYTEGLRDVGGTGRRVASDMSAGIGGAIRELQAAWEGLKITLGETFNDELIAGFRAVRDWITILQQKIKQLNDDGTLRQWFIGIQEVFGWMVDALKTAYHEVDQFTKIVIAGVAAVSGNMDIARAAIDDFVKSNDDYLRSKGLLRDAAVIEQEALEKNIAALQKQIDVTQAKIDQNKEDAKSWRASILGSQAYQDELEKNEARLSSLQEEMAKLLDKKHQVDLDVDATQIENLVDQGVWGRGEAVELPMEIVPEAGPIGRAASTGDPSKAAKEATASAETLLRSEEAKLQAIIEKELAALETMYAQGLVDLNQYFVDRQALTTESIEAEVELLRARLELEDDPNKKQAILDKIFALEQAHQAALLQLTQERFEAEKSLEQEKLREQKKIKDQQIAAEQAFANLKARVDASGQEALAADFQKEIADLQMRQAVELEVFRQGKENEAQMKEFYRLQEQEKDQLAADQNRRLMEFRYETAASVAGGIADVFANMYELSGKKSKEFFYAEKAVRVAEATINTANAVTGALGSPPYGYGAIATAAIIAAMGAAQIAKIVSTGLAAGGEVPGYSPTKTSDNILARLTAGEYVQRVDAVNYYGKDVMDAMNNMQIPREIFGGFQMPRMAAVPKANYATGGQVADGPATKESQGDGRSERPININNFIDPSMMSQHMQSSQGQRDVWNVLSQNPHKLKQMVYGQ